MSYTVVIQSEIEELINVVNDLMMKGWEPLDGPSYSSLGNRFWYQAMIKE